MKKVNLLINLPEGFFATPCVQPLLSRLGRRATIRRRSHNKPEEIARDLRWAEAVIMWAWPNLSPELLASAAKLRFVGHINVTRSTAEAELGAKIAVSEVRHCWSPAVAEMALTLMLGCLRQTSAYHAAMRAGKENWDSVPEGADPRERQLTGRSVGIIGLGGIGRRLAELLKPFKVQLRVYDPYVPAHAVARYGAESVPLMELLHESEIVVLAAAQSSETVHLLGKQELAALRKNAVFVNISRSSLVDMKALAARLKQGDLVAALDVFDQEPLPKNSPLRKLPNTYLTPHRAGGLLESVVRALTMLSDDFEAHLDGQRRRYAVTAKMLSCFSD